MKLGQMLNHQWLIQKSLATSVIHASDVKRDKLGQRAKVGILVGYNIVSKGYRILNPITKKIYGSRSVKFNENDPWNWEKMIEESPNQDSIVANTPQAFDDVSKKENYDDEHYAVKGTRTLQDVYNRCDVALYEPALVNQALQSLKWKSAMEEEFKMIMKNDTWSLVDGLADQQVIGSKWVFMMKKNLDGSISKYNARLVVKGYSQQQNIDFSETFTPVARFDTELLAVTAYKGWKVYQLDVKLSFLNGVLNEKIDIKQPEGFATKMLITKFIS